MTNKKKQTNKPKQTQTDLKKKKENRYFQTY
jgi:hypothetical protein